MKQLVEHGRATAPRSARPTRASRSPTPQSYPLRRQYTVEKPQKLTPQILQLQGNENDPFGGRRHLLRRLGRTGVPRRLRRRRHELRLHEQLPLPRRLPAGRHPRHPRLAHLRARRGQRRERHGPPRRAHARGAPSRRGLRTRPDGRAAQTGSTAPRRRRPRPTGPSDPRPRSTARPGGPPSARPPGPRRRPRTCWSSISSACRSVAGQQRGHRVLVLRGDAVAGVPDDHPRLGGLVPVLPPVVHLVPLRAGHRRLAAARPAGSTSSTGSCGTLAHVARPSERSRCCRRSPRSRTRPAAYGHRPGGARPIGSGGVGGARGTGRRTAARPPSPASACRPSAPVRTVTKATSPPSSGQHGRDHHGLVHGRVDGGGRTADTSRPTTIGRIATARRPARRAMALLTPDAAPRCSDVGRRHDRGRERRDRARQAEAEHDRPGQHRLRRRWCPPRRGSRGAARPPPRPDRSSSGAGARCAAPRPPRGDERRHHEQGDRQQRRSRPRGPSSRGRPAAGGRAGRRRR